MQEEIKNIVKNTGDIIKDRFFSPMYSYFIISWVLWNWKFVFVLLFVDNIPQNLTKIDYLLSFYSVESYFSILYNFIILFVGPAVSTFVFMWWLSILSEKFYKKSEQHKQNLRVIDRELKYDEKVKIANREREIRDLESDKKKIQYFDNKEFNDYLDESQNDLDVFGYKMRPSEVLYHNDYEAYKEKFEDWKVDRDYEIDAAGDAYIQQQIDIARGK